MRNYIQSLRDAVKRLHGCEAAYLRAEPVKETFQGATVWEGEVVVFDLANHPSARQCYAWAFDEGNGHWRYVAILHAPPVDSPLKAVRAFIINEAKSKAPRG